MTETSQSSLILNEPLVVDVDQLASDLLPEDPQTVEQWKEVLNNDVKCQGGYLDQMYPPPPPQLPKGEVTEWQQKAYAGQAESYPTETILREKEKAKNKEDVLKREQSRFDKIYNAGIEMAEGTEGAIAFLFDVDDTFSDLNAEGDRVLSPAFRRAISALHQELGNRLRVGVLTTMNAKWVLKHCFEGVDPRVIAPEYVLDTRAYAKLAYPDMDEEEARKGLREVSIERLASILNPKLYDAIVEKKLPTDIVYSDSKLEILSELDKYETERIARSEKAGQLYHRTRFIFVDNMLYSGMLNPNNPYVRGVNVGREVQDSQGRRMYEAQYITLYIELLEKELSDIQLAI